MRLDQFLIEKHKVASRAQAQELIDLGLVFITKESLEQILSKANYQVKESEQNLIFIKDNLLEKFVSRGGVKLFEALKFLELNINNLRVFDVGQSTGGFTDCLLQAGASEVVGLDVGCKQIHKKIKMDSRVKVFENKNIREIEKDFDLAPYREHPFDLLVGDLSFISLTHTLAQALIFLKPGGMLLHLVKPQFEMEQKSSAAFNKKGVIKSKQVYLDVQDKIEKHCVELGLEVLKYFPSVITGKEGNQEFFIYAQKSI